MKTHQTPLGLVSDAGLLGLVQMLLPKTLDRRESHVAIELAFVVILIVAAYVIWWQNEKSADVAE